MFLPDVVHDIIRCVSLQIKNVTQKVKFLIRCKMPIPALFLGHSASVIFLYFDSVLEFLLEMRSQRNSEYFANVNLASHDKYLIHFQSRFWMELAFWIQKLRWNFSFIRGFYPKCQILSPPVGRVFEGNSYYLGGALCMPSDFLHAHIFWTWSYT